MPTTPPRPARGARPAGLPRLDGRLPAADPGRVSGRLAPAPARPRLGAGGRRGLEELARRPLPRPAVVLVTSVAGGAGRSTLTAGLGATLAGLRREPVLAVEATTAPAGALAARAGAAGGGSLWDLLAAPPAAGPRGLAAAGAGGLHVLPAGRPGAGRPVTPPVLAAGLARLAGWYRLLLVDSGVPATDPLTWPWVCREAGVVVLVCRPDEVELGVAAETLQVWARAGMACPAGRVLLVVNHPTGRRPPRAARAAEQLVAGRTAGALRLANDRRLAGAGPVHPPRLRARTRAGLLRLAAACVAGLGGEQE